MENKVITLGHPNAIKTPLNVALLRANNPAKSSRVIPQAFIQLEYNWNPDRSGGVFEIFLRTKSRFGFQKSVFLTHLLQDQPIEVLDFGWHKNVAFVNLFKSGDVAQNNWRYVAEFTLSAVSSAMNVLFEKKSGY